MTSSPTPVHLLTCVHGMWGEPAHVSRIAEVMLETHKAASGEIELDVLIAETNKTSHTYDGVDWGAERVVQETRDRIASIEKDGTKKVVHFSIFGYSLGGLLARYAVGILNSQGFFDQVAPMNFATIATPNIGLLRYKTFFSGIQHTFGPTLLSRTGSHFYATDDWKDGKPLLEAMSEKGSVFYDGLAKFKHVSIYANAINDLTVPYITAAIEPYDPFVGYIKDGVEIDLDEKYPPIIKSYSLPKGPAPELPPPPKFLSRTWFKTWWNGPSRLPPPLQRPFPFNVIIIVLLPVLIPLLFTAVLGNFTYNVFHSKRRIRLLESSGKHNRSALMTFMQNIERGVEDAVVDFMDDDPHDADPVPDAGPSNVTTPSRANTPIPPSAKAPSTTNAKLAARRMSITYTPVHDPHSPYSRNTSDAAANQPILTPAQERMITNLNTLPQLKKYRVFLDGMRNSHATIVCRDLKNFEFHKRGEGVLRHLADGFEM